MSARLVRPLGHDRLTERLADHARALRAGEATRMHHAWLFTGPRGVGKLTTARWWACLLQCPNPGQCAGDCHSCRMVAGGVHPDVVLVEANDSTRGIGLEHPSGSAKHGIGVDAARMLVQRMAARPRERGPRVAIVADADTLQPAAQQSLLKFLEEPPGFTVVILVAANAGSLLPTVRSRCQVARFGVVADEHIRTLLAARGLTGAAADRAVEAAMGSVGRAVAFDEAGLVRRSEILTAFDDFRRGELELEDMLARLEAEKEAGYGLPELFEAETTRARELALASGADALGQAVDEASLVLWTLRAITERNANAKIALRDMLLQMEA
jgi:DNA polymerase III delta' subunit